jgi:hypothetical protein
MTHDSRAASDPIGPRPPLGSSELVNTLGRIVAIMAVYSFF